jgi:hypothetical protein
VTTDLTAPRVAASLEELVAGATDRVEVRSTDAKSGAQFETLRIDGVPLFLKVLSAEADWIMRVTGNDSHWEYRVWCAGIYQRFPRCIDHTIVGMALEGSGSSARLSILMDDVTPHMVPSGDSRIPAGHHSDFIDHMAAMHAHFLGWRDELGLADPAHRFAYFAPETLAPELERDDVSDTMLAAVRGWGLLSERTPRLHDLVRAVHRDPQALADALATTPATFVGGDWKLGNIGRRPDGRTILVDQAYPGEAAPCGDLAWYLALNRARLPISKAKTIAHYRERLEHYGVDTTDWWDRQLGLSLVGAAALFGWEKALGDQAELDWWERAALDGARWL